jgi:hypothetical protein
VTTPTPTPGPLSLNGTETQDFTYNYGYPNKIPPFTQTTTIAQTVTVAPTSLASPFPAGTANDVHIAEVDSIDALQTIALTTDSYTATSGNNVVLYGSISDTPSSGNGQATIAQLVYAKPHIVDQTTQTGGATWTNTAGAQFTENFSDGHSEDRIIADDGTYHETGTTQAPDGSGLTPINLIEQKTGAGSYSGPFFSYGNVTWSLTTPAGSPSSITLGYTINGSARKTYANIPGWFAAKPIFYAEGDVIRANVSVPGGCAAGTGTVNEVVQKTRRLDTVIGYTELSERDAYSAGGTVVCVVFNDTLQNYYDWNGDTPFAVYTTQNGKKISQVVTTLTLTSGAASASAAVRRAHSVRSAGIPIAAIGALQEHFNAKIEATKRKLFASKRGAK